MFQSKKPILTSSSSRLRADLEELLRKKKRIRSKSLGRFVSLQKLPEVITRRRDAKRRLQAFWVALDIVQYAPSYRDLIVGEHKCFELRGKDASGEIVIVHLREERVRKDRILYFVSCAPK